MQCQKLSSKTHKDIDKQVRKCIWGSSLMKRNIHLLSWDVLCRPNSEGGGGLQRPEDIIKCMLAKLGWRLLTCDGNTWCQNLRDKYKVNEEGVWQFKHKQQASQIWKGVLWSSELLRTGLRWRITNGKSALFWKDKWAGDETLMNQRWGPCIGDESERWESEYWHDE